MKPKEMYGLPNYVQGLSPAEASERIIKAFSEKNDLPSKNTLNVFMRRLDDAQKFTKQQLGLNNPQGSQNQLANGTDYLPLGISNVVNEVALAKQLSGQQDESLPPTGNFFNRTFSNDNSWWKRDDSKNGINILSGIGLGISALAPMLANRMAAKSLTPPKDIEPLLMDETVSPFFVNRQQIQRNITNQASSNRYALRNASSGDFGQYAANLQALNAGTSNAVGNAMLQADLADAEEKRRIQGLQMSLRERNLRERTRVQEMNQQNRAAYDSQIAAFRQATGANIANIGTTLFNMLQAKGYGDAWLKKRTLDG